MSEPTGQDGRELWSITRVMQHIGVNSRTGARVFLHRAGITARHYVPGDSGRPEGRYDAAAVRAAAARRPGKGRRTDLGKQRPPDA